MVNATQMGDTERFVIDAQVQHLLVQTINSPLKLHLVLLFLENPRLEGSARQIIQRIYRDVWSTGEALRELARDGILAVTGRADEPVYRYQPQSEYRGPLARLVEQFNDPFAREAIYATLRGSASDTVYQHVLARSVGEPAMGSCGCPLLYDSINSIAN